jgi:predicted RNase H-like nuclease (RuvC/YqgF family)
LLIQNLKERLGNLEDRVSGINSERQRDKSQQRIKDAIMNLERKLEQFHKEREENTLKLLEINTHSSLQSSSRHSENFLQTNAYDFHIKDLRPKSSQQ